MEYPIRSLVLLCVSCISVGIYAMQAPVLVPPTVTVVKTPNDACALYNASLTLSALVEQAARLIGNNYPACQQTQSKSPLTYILTGFFKRMVQILEHRIQALERLHFLKNGVVVEVTGVTERIDFSKALHSLKSDESRQIPVWASKLSYLLKGPFVHKEFVDSLCTILRHNYIFNFIIESQIMRRYSPSAQDYTYITNNGIIAITHTTPQTQPVATPPTVLGKRTAEQAQLTHNVRASYEPLIQELTDLGILKKDQITQYTKRLTACFTPEQLGHLGAFFHHFHGTLATSAAWLPFLASDAFFKLERADYVILFQACKLLKRDAFETIMALCNPH